MGHDTAVCRVCGAVNVPAFLYSIARFSCHVYSFPFIALVAIRTTSASSPFPAPIILCLHWALFTCLSRRASDTVSTFVASFNDFENLPCTRAAVSAEQSGVMLPYWVQSTAREPAVFHVRHVS